MAKENCPNPNCNNFVYSKDCLGSWSNPWEAFKAWQIFTCTKCFTIWHQKLTIKNKPFDRVVIIPGEQYLKLSFNIEMPFINEEQAEIFEDKIALAAKPIFNEFGLKGKLHNTITGNSMTIDDNHPNPIPDNWTHSRE